MIQMCHRIPLNKPIFQTCLSQILFHHEKPAGIFASNRLIIMAEIPPVEWIYF